MKSHGDLVSHKAFYEFLCILKETLNKRFRKKISSCGTVIPRSRKDRNNVSIVSTVENLNQNKNSLATFSTVQASLKEKMAAARSFRRVIGPPWLYHLHQELLLMGEMY